MKDKPPQSENGGSRGDIGTDVFGRSERAVKRQKPAHAARSYFQPRASPSDSSHRPDFTHQRRRRCAARNSPSSDAWSSGSVASNRRAAFDRLWSQIADPAEQLRRARHRDRVLEHRWC